MRSTLDNVLPDVAFRRLSVASAFIFDVDRTLADPHERMEEGILSELARLRVPAGVATARTLSELEESLPSGKEHLLVSKALPIFRTSYYFCACSDLSLSYEAYDFSFQSEV